MRYSVLLFREAAILWYSKDSGSLSATVSYYMLFALTPLLLLMVLFSSVFYGRTFVVETLNNWGSVLGAEVLALLHSAVVNLEILSYGYGIPLVAILFFSWAVITMLNTFTTGLQTLWGVTRSGIQGWFHKTFRSLLFVVLFEMYLFVFIGVSYYITKLIDLTGFFGLIVIKPIFFIAITTLLFSLVYGVLLKQSPSRKARLLGGFVASIMLLLAKTLVSFYLAKTLVPGLFGAAGLILVILIWLYVSVAIIYYGAAFAFVTDASSKKFKKI